MQSVRPNMCVPTLTIVKAKLSSSVFQKGQISNLIPSSTPGHLAILYGSPVEAKYLFYFLFVSQQFRALAVDCLNPLLSNKSLCGVKFEYVRAAGARSTF